MKIPLVALLATLGTSLAQVPDAAPAGAPPAGGGAPAAQPAQGPAGAGGGNAANGGNSFLGKDVPFFDPGSEVATWDGKSWNINNNRIFQARFQKYLNSPPATREGDQAYQKVLQQIMDLLAPGRVTPQSLDTAFQLLSKASQYPEDANLCDSIGNQVYSAWMARRNNDRLTSASKSLEEEMKRLDWNAKMTAESNLLESGGGGKSGGKDGGANQDAQKNEQTKRDLELQPILTRKAEIAALLKTNQLKKEVAELQVKIDFQALIVQHFLQRRFQHVVIGTRFYRSVFADGDSQLRVGEDAKNLFSKTSGLPPTMGTVDSMANEIMHDVHDGVAAFQFLLEKGEMESATKRLAETFIVGEYMPEVRTLPRDEKRQALAFDQKADQLLSALQVKDYTLAESLVKDLHKSASDFDTSKPTAAIETARQVAAMHIAKARNAALSGDKATLEEELKSAGEIWPLNPALKEVSKVIFEQGDVTSRAIVDFNQLLSQKNYRQIYDDKARFIYATAMYPEQKEKLTQVLSDMQVIETAIIQAQEIEKNQNFPGAWESAEKAYRKFPDDNKLNNLRADLTTKASDYVHAIRLAEDLEQKGQPGSSLAWYLKAQKEYPPSEFAHDGIKRLTKEILPDAT
ncbi:hypothetical protein BH09VER1_BH09VER1_33170 [soil metagenome]